MIKILATIGPKSNNLECIENFAKTTNLFRLNGSHGTIEWHAAAVNCIRTVCPNAFILMDIPGIKPRTNNSQSISIEKNQEVIFGKKHSNNELLAVELTKDLPNFDRQIQKFSVNDGQFEFDFLSSGPGYILGKSRSSFTLLTKKGLNLPYSIYDEVKQLEIYTEFLDSIKHLDIDGLGLSFVQTGGLVDELRNLASNLVLIAKIENSEGLKNCIDIVESSDAIMIDRGDLAAEIGFDGLFDAISLISGDTKARGKPLIMATENLETMIDRDVPSKSEIISLAHSASIGVDCIMLSDETATADSGQSTVLWLDAFLSSCNRKNEPITCNKVVNKFPAIWHSLANLEQIPIILVTKSGYALFEFFSIKPEGEIILVTNNSKLLKICDLYANKISIIRQEIGDIPSETLWELIALHKEKFFKEYDQIAAVYVSKYVNSARANSITIFDKTDFY